MTPLNDSHLNRILEVGGKSVRPSIPPISIFFLYSEDSTMNLFKGSDVCTAGSFSVLSMARCFPLLSQARRKTQVLFSSLISKAKTGANWNRTHTRQDWGYHHSIDSSVFRFWNTWGRAMTVPSKVTLTKGFASWAQQRPTLAVATSSNSNYRWEGRKFLSFLSHS